MLAKQSISRMVSVNKSGGNSSEAETLNPPEAQKLELEKSESTKE